MKLRENKLEKSVKQIQEILDDPIISRQMRRYLESELDRIKLAKSE